MQETEERATLPAEIELTELEAMKLTAISATIGKLHAEIQVAELQIEKLQRAIEDRSAKVAKFVNEIKQIQRDVAGRYNLPNLDAYDIDLASKRGRLRPPPAEGR